MFQFVNIAVSLLSLWESYQSHRRAEEERDYYAQRANYESEQNSRLREELYKSTEHFHTVLANYNNLAQAVVTNTRRAVEPMISEMNDEREDFDLETKEEHF